MVACAAHMGAFGKLGIGMLLATSACYEVLDVRDYRVIDSATCEAPTSKGTPLYDATCMACLEAHCGKGLATCEADPECAALFAASRECVDPPCWEDLSMPYGGFFSTNWPLFGSGLEGCQISRCPEECRIGTNFDCLGQYGYTSHYAFKAPFDITVSVWHVSGPPVQGAEVKACRASCAEHLDAATTDESGAAVLRVAADEYGAGFLGYFMAQAEGLGPSLIQQNHPFVDAIPAQVALASPDDHRSFLELAGASAYDPTRALVLVYVSDCHAWPVPQAGFGDRYSIAIDPPDPESAIYYGKALNLPAQAFIYHLSPGEKRVTVTDGCTVIASAPFQAVAGGGTGLFLWPNAAGQ